MVFFDFSVTVTKIVHQGSHLLLMILKKMELVRRTHMGVMGTMETMRLTMQNDETAELCRLVAEYTAKQ